MKTMNEFRSTNKFCITEPSIGHMAAIFSLFGNHLVSIACDNQDFIYTVRVSNSKTGIMDYQVKVFGDRVDILEKVVIMDWQEDWHEAVA